jgi:hypothetical protein
VYFTIYFRVIKLRRKRWSEHAVCVGEARNTYNTLVGKRKGTRPLERSTHGWEDNIGRCVREIGWEDLDWMHH